MRYPEPNATAPMRVTRARRAAPDRLTRCTGARLRTARCVRPSRTGKGSERSARNRPSRGVIAAVWSRHPEVEVDRDLVERARKADREAFAVLVHQVSDSLYAIAY